VRRALILVLFLLCGSAFADDYSFVRNAANPTAQLSASEVKDLYTGKKKEWSNGAPVQLVLTGESSPELGWLASTFYGVSSRSLLSKIKQEVFKGEMAKPIMVESEAETIEKLKTAKGGIGIVSAAAAKALPSTVVTIQVNK
jgi:ABC-type phosphate transport system substrate-binding protein